MDIQAVIKQQVTENPVVLYMKGTPTFPQCGFSSAAAQILKACGVTGLRLQKIAGPQSPPGDSCYILRGLKRGNSSVGRAQPCQG